MTKEDLRDKEIELLKREIDILRDQLDFEKSKLPNVTLNTPACTRKHCGVDCTPWDITHVPYKITCGGTSNITCSSH